MNAHFEFGKRILIRNKWKSVANPLTKCTMGDKNLIKKWKIVRIIALSVRLSLCRRMPFSFCQSDGSVKME